MIQGYVARQISRNNRNLLITNVIIAIIVLTIPLLTRQYISECLNGPFPSTPDAISKLNTAGDAPHSWVRVPIDRDQIDDSDFHIHVSGRSSRDDYYYFLHLQGGKFLIIKTSSKGLPAVVEGSISNPDSEVTNDVISGIAGHVEGDALPVIIDTSSYRAGLYAMIAIGVPILLINIWNILKAFLRMGNPLSHPAAKQLAKIGPPEEIAVAVDAEVNEGGAKVGKVLTTRSWLIRPSAFGTDLVYLGDIVWAYKHETVHKSYGVTTNRTYSTIIFDVRGKRWQFSLNQAQVDGLLGELKTRVPWAIIGFNKDLQTAWQKNRKSVLATVEQRKQQLTAQSAGAPADTSVPPVG